MALQNTMDKSPYLRDETRQSEMRMAQTALVARLFEEAATSFRGLSVSATDPVLGVSAAWGEAIAQFAYGGSSRSAFERVVASLGSDGTRYARLLGAFLDYLPTEEGERIGDVARWRERVSEVLGGSEEPAIRNSDVAIEYQFTRLMRTIGRPDILVPFVMDRIELVRDTPREAELVRRLGATLQACYNLISFSLVSEGGWTLRSTEGYDPLLDFVRDSGAGGQPSGREEVPYSASTPEEDRVETMQAYLFAERSATTGLSDVETWVEESGTRGEPGASIVPHLKVVWIDWFGRAFAAALSPSFRASEFHYEAMDASALVEVERVRELRDHPSTTRHHRNLIDLFVRTRLFLEEAYG